ncbi:site-2 protease. Metallo peptidase. MEROPS family M50B [Fodinibius roseus]|uniref:Zinc metalloprotease n=1 Tax=Fodinibius roseus TaxID=1194090 RepID=A0A1M4SX94_9BACT|nr:RIP metalloprotease RseP [Fodinibius roseus]SHE36814.1 site-2 protease. Metallo peptidase. MEROPS family M50B [Fodinibius roseus]
MEWILGLLSTLAIFAAALLILVFFHELGHFLAAKLFGMRVERFSVGFPPRIFGIKKGETDYCIGATPLGGYVKISGMIDESMDTDYLEEEPKPWEFRSKPVWQRIVVITAGVIFNMILAVIIYAGMAYSTGETKVQLDSVNGIYVSEGSLADEVGFQTGDRLVGVNGEEVAYFNELFAPQVMTSSTLSYTVMRDGRQATVTVADSLLNDIGQEGLINLSNAMPSSISRIQPGSPAEEAGLQGGDIITSINDREVSHWSEAVELISTADDSISLTINRGGETLAYTILPDANNKLGIYAPEPDSLFEIDRFKYGLFESVNIGIERSNATLTGIVQGFSKMFSGDIAVRESLGGPVAIANVTKEATDRGGWIGFWNITAFLSITLAIMNILPIPVLDGGHLMFLIYEGITRREPSPKVRMWLQQIGFLLIIALFIFVTFNDILRQFG